MSKDDLISLVLQKDSELVKCKLKSCELYNNLTIPIKEFPYSTKLNEDLPVKFTFKFKDGQEAVFNDYKGMQDFLDKMENVHKLEKENKVLQEKLDIAVKALEEYARDDFWDNCKETWSGTLVHKGLLQKDGYLSAKQALAKIKEIK